MLEDILNYSEQWIFQTLSRTFSNEAFRTHDLIRDFMQG